jgi:Transcriptional regulator/sugar kinase
MTLGIDIGGTNLSFGLVEDSKVTEGFSVPSFAPGASLEETLEYLASKISSILVPSVRKIGIGVPSVVDVKQGIVYDTQNIPSWTVVPLKEYLEARFNIPVAVNNDANCYALGVYGSYPVGGKPETLVAMTLGTGLGVGIVDRGVLFCGANCGAGELGCLPYADSIIEDYCSKKFFTAAGWNSMDANKAAKARGVPLRWPSSTSSAVTWARPSAPRCSPMIPTVSPSPAASRTTIPFPQGHGGLHPGKLPVPESHRTPEDRHLYRQ